MINRELQLSSSKCVSWHYKKIQYSKYSSHLIRAVPCVLYVLFSTYTFFSSVAKMPRPNITACIHWHRASDAAQMFRLTTLHNTYYECVWFLRVDLYGNDITFPWIRARAHTRRMHQVSHTRRTLNNPTTPQQRYNVTAATYHACYCDAMVTKQCQGQGFEPQCMPWMHNASAMYTKKKTQCTKNLSTGR